MKGSSRPGFGRPADCRRPRRGGTALAVGLAAMLTCTPFACKGGGGSDRMPPPPGPAPDAPAGVAAAGGDSEVAVLWLPVSGAITYNIYWDISPGVTPATGVAVTDLSGPTVVTGLSNGATHYFVVTAVNVIGEGPGSTEVTAIPMNTGGTVVVHDGAAGGLSTDIGFALALDGAGRILVAGTSVNIFADFDMVIWRYNPSGTPDLSFGAAGFVAHDGAAGGFDADYGLGIAVDAAGRALVCGASISASGDFDMVLWRYNANGTLDTSFGTGGIVLNDGAAGGVFSDDFSEDLLLDASGDIVVVGSSTNAALNFDMTILRYNPNGTLDGAFGNGGVVFHDGAAGGFLNDFGNGLAIDGLGRIVAVGTSANAFGDSDLAIWRYNGDGTLDTTFGGVGSVTHDNAAGGAFDDEGTGVVIDSNGNVVACGWSVGPRSDWDMVIWRYNSDGSLDSSFGGVGWVVHDDAGGGLGDDRAFGVTVDLLDRIIATGSSDSATIDDDMVIWRYAPDGTLQTLTVDRDAAGGTGEDIGRGIASGGLGQVYVAGQSVNAFGDSDMVIWSYY